MHLTITIPLLSILVGLLMFCLTTGKVSEIGKYLFACGYLVLLLEVAGRTLRITG